MIVELIDAIGQAVTALWQARCLRMQSGCILTSDRSA
jgi:hypothetical protein